MEESKCDHRVCCSAVWTEAVYSNMWGTFPWMFACGLALFFLSWEKLGLVTRVQTQHPGIHPSTWPLPTSLFLSRHWGCSCSTDMKCVAWRRPLAPAWLFFLCWNRIAYTQTHFSLIGATLVWLQTPPAPLPAVHNHSLHYFLKNLSVSPDSPSLAPPLSHTHTHTHSLLHTHPQPFQHICFCFCIWPVFYSSIIVFKHSYAKKSN